MKIGEYEIEEQIGAGGVGIVYAARSPRGERVALKLLRALEKDDLARFEREERLLEKLSGEGGFVPLLDSGTAPSGPYIVMPFLAGGTLRDRLLVRHVLTAKETATLGVKLARALGRAHAAGVVHRDVKPENVLFAADGAPLLADLGLAKHFRRDVAGASRSGSITREDELQGTAQYMAPEQWEDLRTAGPPADVFALGALLYECLAGVQAFSGPALAKIALAARAGDFAPLREAAPEAPAALARVIERALDPDVANRFPDGEAFAKALEGAERPSAPRAPLLVAAAVLAALAVAVLALRGPRSEPGRVEGTAPRTHDAPLPAITKRFRASKRTRLLHVLGRYEGRHGSAILCLSAARGARPRALTGSADRTLKLWDLATGEEIAALESHAAPVRCALLSPGGTRALSGGDDRSVRLWDVALGRLLRVLGEHAAPVSALAFSPDGRWAASSSESSVKLWDLESGREAASFTAGGRVLALDLREDALRAATSAGTVSVWDTHTLAPRETAPAEKGELLLARFTDEGRAVIAVTSTGVELRGDGPARRIEAPGATTVALSPSGTLVAIGFADGRIVGHEPATGGVRGPYPIHAAAVTDLAFLDEDRVISVSDDHSLRITDLKKSRYRADSWGDYEGHAGAVLAIVPREDGRVLTGGLDGTVRVWRTTDGRVSKLLKGHAKAVTGVAWSPDGEGAFSASWDGTVRAWNLARVEGRVLSKHPARLFSLAPSQDGRFLFGATQDGLVLALDAASGEVLGRLRGHEGAVLSFGVAPDGRHGLSAGLDGTARFWDLDEGEPTRPPFAAGTEVFAATFLESGREAVLACRDGALRVTGERPALLRGHGAEVFSVARSGSLLASTSQDQTVRLWDLASMTEVDRIDLAPSADYGVTVAFAPGGGSFFVGTARGVVLHFESVR